MKIEELHDRAAWAEFTEKHGGGILQSFEMGELHAKTEGTPLYLVARDDEGIRLAALVLRKPLGFGYSFYHIPEGPTLKDGDWSDGYNQVALAMLKAHLRRRALRDRAVYLKLEPHVDESHREALELAGLRRSEKSHNAEHVAVVDIRPASSTIWKNFKKDARYSIRYAERQGVEVIRGRGPRELSLFTKLYHGTARTKKFAFRDTEYLEQLRQTLMEDCERADIFVAMHRGEPVAASIVTYYGEEAVYLYAGSSKANQTLYGTYLLQWAAIQEAKKRGCRVYNMTGVSATADPEDPWYGLRQFKLKFGAQVAHLAGAYDAVYKPGLYRAMELGSHLQSLIRPRQVS